MTRLFEWAQATALALGAPGLFLVAVLDSSFLSFPQVVDLLVIYLTTQNKERVILYALAATIGSLIGCFALYSVARKGGEAFLRKRFHERHVERAMRLFQRHGLFAVLIPSLLPPPAPFKLFVLASGVAGVRRVDFLLAIALGRGIRYFGAAFLAVWYGDQAAEFLRENARIVTLLIALVALSLAAGWLFWQKRRSAEEWSG